MFAVDFRPYARLMSASPGSVLEIPVGLFFVGGHGRGSRLMPLAIQFSVNNRNVYSPADSRADWLLAKAVFNAIDTAMHATIHFLQSACARLLGGAGWGRCMTGRAALASTPWAAQCLAWRSRARMPLTAISTAPAHLSRQIISC